MTEKFLVTGGSGFIGSHLIDEIAKRGFELINLDINPPSIQEQTRYWRQCDIKDRSALRPAFQEIMPTRVIHLAAKANLIGKTIDGFSDNLFRMVSVSAI